MVDCPGALNWMQVVDIADLALYAAKKSSRNAWVGLMAADTPTSPAEMVAAQIFSDPADLIARKEIEALTSLDGNSLLWK
jgi:hypothetical protein